MPPYREVRRPSGLRSPLRPRSQDAKEATRIGVALQFVAILIREATFATLPGQLVHAGMVGRGELQFKDVARPLW